MHVVAKFTLWLFVDRVKSVGATAQQQPGRPHKLKSHDNEKQMFPRGGRVILLLFGNSKRQDRNIS